jgi:hypothetical protein
MKFARDSGLQQAYLKIVLDLPQHMYELVDNQSAIELFVLCRVKLISSAGVLLRYHIHVGLSIKGVQSANITHKLIL